MKKFLPILVFIFALLPDVAFAGTKLHMVLFGNTSDNSIGRSMLVDVSYYDRLSKELKAIIAEENVELIYHRFLGSDCNPAMANDQSSVQDSRSFFDRVRNKDKGADTSD